MTLRVRSQGTTKKMDNKKMDNKKKTYGMRTKMKQANENLTAGSGAIRNRRLDCIDAVIWTSSDGAGRTGMWCRVSKC